MIYQRYSLAEGGDGVNWSIIDIFTGTAACVFDMTMAELELEEAATFTDLLNDYDMQKQVLYAVQSGSGQQTLDSLMQQLSIDKFTQTLPRAERRDL